MMEKNEVLKINNVLSIEKLKPDHAEQLSQLKVAEEQIKFVGTMEEILANVNTYIHPYVILVECRVVGFFLIDTRYAQCYDFASQYSLGLRAYFIGCEFQGMGYGKAAIKVLAEQLHSTYPSYSDIYLTVNCKNSVAKQCYLKAGFVDTEQLYLGGAAGPQHVMYLTLSQ